MMIRTELKYGIITGIGICLWITFEYLMGFHSTKMEIGEVTTYFSALIPLTTIYFGIKEKRDKRYEGSISFDYAVRTGLMITLIAAVITAAFLIIYYNYINPDFFRYGIAYHKQKMLLRGKSEQEIAADLDRISGTFGFVNQLLFGILGTVGIGAVLTVAVAALLRRDVRSSVSV